MRVVCLCFVLCTSFVLVSTASAQPPADDSTWTGSIAASVALTGGNTSTTSTNFAFNVESPQSARHVLKVEGLNIRSTRDGTSIVDRTSLSGRHEYGLGERAYLFEQFQYLRDVFKSIAYLIAPTVGLGYNLAESETTNVSLDASVGAVREKNVDLPERTSGALTVRQNATHQVSPMATLTQSVNALWKTEDFGDALYTLKGGVAASVTTRIQVKVEFVDTFKTEPPSDAVRRNDTAFITSFGFTF